MADRAATDETPSRLRVRLAISGLIACVVVILGITMWPQPVDRGLEGTVARVLELLHELGTPNWFGYAHLEFSANVLMFMPLGFFITLLLSRRRRWIAFVLPPLMSAAIELTQLLLLSARFATLSDVVANSVGGWIGVGIALLIVRK